jgi:glycosyltransferase involved in cell wall biosynthesis
MEKIRILFLLNSLNPGGAERQFLNLLSKLDNTKFLPIVVTYYPGGKWDARIRENLFALNLKHRFDLPGMIFRLKKIAKETKPHIIYGLYGDSCLFSLIQKTEKMRVIWGLRASNIDFSRYSFFSGLIYKINAFLSGFADAIIVNSYTGFEYNKKKGYSSKKMVVIPNGIDTDYFKKNVENACEIRKALNIPDNCHLIGRIGRYDAMKDYPVFIMACAEIYKKNPDVRFLAVGSGCDNDTLKKMSYETGIGDKLYLLENREDLPDIYSLCDITVSSSSGEGFPNVIAESMSCETPCVATDVGDSRVIVGDFGVVVPPRSPDLIANACFDLLDRTRDFRLEQGKKGRAHIIKNFSIEKMARDTEGVFEKVFGDKRCFF